MFCELIILVFQNNQSTNGSLLNLEQPMDDVMFSLLNTKEESFNTGQFSARSTSFGGSNESETSGNHKMRTRDERFSDFNLVNSVNQSLPKANIGLDKSTRTHENFPLPSFDAPMNIEEVFAAQTENLSSECNLAKETSNAEVNKEVSFPFPLNSNAHDSNLRNELLNTSPPWNSKSGANESEMLKYSLFDLSLKAGGGSILEDLSTLQQDLEGFGGEDFETNGKDALAMMDEAQKEFEEEHRFDHANASASNTNITNDFSVAFSNPSPSFQQQPEASDLLSRTDYFLQNTSR